jgi:hypothetical protein
MIAVCYSKYEVYPDKGMPMKGGDAMTRARKGRESVHAHITASKEKCLRKPVLLKFKTGCGDMVISYRGQ